METNKNTWFIELKKDNNISRITKNIFCIKINLK